MGCRISECGKPEGEDVDHDYVDPAGNSPDAPSTASSMDHTSNTIGRDVSLVNETAEQQEGDTHSPRTQGRIQMEYGKSVISHLSEMKGDLWKKFDKNKDGVLSSQEALQFVRTFLKHFMGELMNDLPAYTAEKIAMEKTAPDKEIQKELAASFLEVLDTDRDGLTTQEEFFEGFELALRTVLDKLFLLHFKGNQEALDVAQSEVVLFIRSPGMEQRSHKLQLLKTKTIGELRDQIEQELAIKRSNQRLWNGFSTLTEITTAHNTYTLEECSKLTPPLRSLDEIHLVGADGIQMQDRNKLHVSVVRLRRSRGFGSDSVFVDIQPEWAQSQRV
eukprot:TRINITY_DN10516_c0_g1_i4.p1 TRINITY_DN10516_c0_g1~~TRINITY_DN10516_c0_g1_i4.p1  ORF type:complete len:332 (-),score=105.15 TRINITY_DN10516_c0_g1_i4:204-1199(-)